MKAVLVAALASLVALPVAAQSGGHSGFAYPDQHRTWSSYSRHGYDYDRQRDRPGDFRCDAYWDRGRDDCGASWRDQRPFARHYSSGRGHGYDHGRHRSGQGGGYVYQPYNQGTQYYGAYGRPDQVYPGGGYGGQVGGAYGDPSGGHRDAHRSAWCASRYRSYDPVSGTYLAYSGRRIYCG